MPKPSKPVSSGKTTSLARSSGKRVKAGKKSLPTGGATGTTATKRSLKPAETVPIPTATSLSVAGVSSPAKVTNTATTSHSATSLILQAELAARVLARRRLLPFVKRLNKTYDAGWVHEDICERLERFSEAVARKESPRLMLLMPPRHGKSELASRNFPAWHLGRHPEHEFIACSYNLDLARTFSRKVQQIIDDPLYTQVFPTAALDPNNRSTESWALQGATGAYVAAGIGGPITGRGAHILVIDDPIKNAEEADSADAREKIWQWYLSTAYTRLAPGGGVLIIQTWWHDDDLAGRLQEAMKATENDEDADKADVFEVVKYPAIAEADEWVNPATHEITRVEFAETDELSGLVPAYARAHRLGVSLTGLHYLRSKGDALHPARYDLARLYRIRAQMKIKGSRYWSALYQQNPVPNDGDYFLKSHFRRAPLPEIKNCNVYIAWDFAISVKEHNDYTVGTVGLQDEHDTLHIADVQRFKSNDAFFIVEAILNQVNRWYSPGLLLGFEDGQIFRAISSLLYKRMRERNMYPAIVMLKPITDKEARARPLQGRMQQGMVSFNDKGEWFDTVKAELLRFPAGLHDDCVDSAAWMTQLCINREPPRSLTRTKPLPSWRDGLKGSKLGKTSHMVA